MIFEETVLVSWNGVVLGVKEMKAGENVYRHTRVKQNREQVKNKFL